MHEFQRDYLELSFFEGLSLSFLEVPKWYFADIRSMFEEFIGFQFPWNPSERVYRVERIVAEHLKFFAASQGRCSAVIHFAVRVWNGKARPISWRQARAQSPTHTRRHAYSHTRTAVLYWCGACCPERRVLVRDSTSKCNIRPDTSCILISPTAAREAH